MLRDGIIVLDKPQNWTSSDCVAVCRRALGAKGIKKVGHGGTLDPMATGVLPIFVGQATRIMEYMDLDYKTYECTARLGLTTDTQDIWGEVLNSGHEHLVRNACCNSGKAVLEAIEEFNGTIYQVPPAYSAVRINGKRLYEYARKGNEPEVEVKPRRAYIKKLEVKKVDAETGDIGFAVECSKGTYIRTICHDLGVKLGCGCVMTSLRRTAVGNISIEDAAVSADAVKTMDSEDLMRLMLPADYPLVNLGSVSISRDRAVYFSRGNSIRWNQVRVCNHPDVSSLLESGKANGTGLMPVNARNRSYEYIYKVYMQETKEFLGVGYRDIKEKLLKADKVFTGRLG